VIAAMCFVAPLCAASSAAFKCTPFCGKCAPVRQWGVCCWLTIVAGLTCGRHGQPSGAEGGFRVGAQRHDSQ
jgi:hypothetical protein